MRMSALFSFQPLTDTKNLKPENLKTSTHQDGQVGDISNIIITGWTTV